MVSDRFYEDCHKEPECCRCGIKGTSLVENVNGLFCRLCLESKEAPKEVGPNILQEADSLTSGARQHEYGHPKENFERLAKLWSVTLGVELTAHQVVLCLIQLKVCRGIQGYKRDTYVDIAGYARCAEMLED